MIVLLFCFKMGFSVNQCDWTSNLSASTSQVLKFQVCATTAFCVACVIKSWAFLQAGEAFLQLSSVSSALPQLSKGNSQIFSKTVSFLASELLTVVWVQTGWWFCHCFPLLNVPYKLKTLQIEYLLLSLTLKIGWINFLVFLQYSHLSSNFQIHVVSSHDNRDFSQYYRSL